MNDFSNPTETLKILTSENITYADLLAICENLMPMLSVMHVNQDGRKYMSITQCILDCIKRIYGFSSCEWVAENKLHYELKQGQTPISFTRINNKGEVCLYKMINFDQIDFDKEIEFADEYEVVKKPSTKKASKVENKDEDKTFLKILTLLKNGENVFLTGFAGTGKSYILNKLKEYFKKKLTITSTTGIAAVNVKGQTLHSWAGVGLCRNTVYNTVEKIKKRPTQYRQIMNCKILAVDEISMLNIEAFEYINEVLREVRECNDPFGGIQVFFIGDFFQLPPVEKEGEIRHYCFDSPVWDKLGLKNVVLKKNYRQNEENFITALAHMRENCLEVEDIELLKTRCVENEDADILHIFSTNEEANRYNFAKFNMIDEPVKLFYAEDGVYRGSKLVTEGFTESENYILEIFSKNCRAEKEIALKLGARVMLLVNMDFNKGLINGACGVIQGFNQDTISIKFDNGIVSNIPKHKFEYYYNERVVAERMQYPLKLAYGITIHKSQGMTLDRLVVDCARIFERGQSYVAMSRVKTLEGLYLKNFEPEKVLVDNRVAEFYENIKEVEEVKPNNLSLEFNKEEEKERVSVDEAKKLILDCVAEFGGQYGKSGFAKILAGSRQIRENGYNEKVTSSSFLGALEGWSQKAIGELIDALVENGDLKVSKISFGRPVLHLVKNISK